MKVIDRKGRFFEKVSIIDVGIIGLLALVLVFSYVFFVQGEDELQVVEAKDIVYCTYEFKDVNEAMTKMPKVGEDVYNSSENYYIGKIVAVDVAEDTERVTNYEEGRHVIVPREDRYTILVTVKSECSVNDRFIMVGNQKTRVGERIPVKGKGYASLSYIVKVELEGEEN